MTNDSSGGLRSDHRLLSLQPFGLLRGVNYTVTLLSGEGINLQINPRSRSLVAISFGVRGVIFSQFSN